VKFLLLILHFFLFFGSIKWAFEMRKGVKTGNAGKRIACAVIGYSKENFA